MASIEQIIKDLADLSSIAVVLVAVVVHQQIARKAAAECTKTALQAAKEINKLDKRRIDLDNKALNY